MTEGLRAHLVLAHQAARKRVQVGQSSLVSAGASLEVGTDEACASSVVEACKTGPSLGSDPKVVATFYDKEKDGF